MTTAGPNYISGITTSTFENTDVVNKSYVDNLCDYSLPSQTGNGGKFLTTTDGISVSWDYVSNYQEFTTPGSQTFTVPSQANLLYIEAVGGGGGGSTGTTGSTFAKNGLTWSLRTSGFGSSLISNITTSGSTYVISGESGTLLSSTDTISWTLRSSGFGTSSINGLTYANNEYIIGGRSETISWILRTSGFGTTDINALGFGNSIYVASGTAGRIISSTDTITWVSRTSGTTLQFGQNAGSGNGIVYDGSVFLASGFSSLLSASTDSISWILRTSGFGTTNINFINFNNSLSPKYIAGSGGTVGTIKTSTDGISWTFRTAGNSANINAGIFGPTTNTNYVVGGSFGTILTSTDSIAWTTRTNPGFGSSNIWQLTYGNVFVSGGTVGLLTTSTDAINWTLRTSGFGTTGINALAYNNNLYVIGGSTAAGTAPTATSTDAIVWTMRTTASSLNVYALFYVNNIFIAAGQSALLQTSTQTILSSYGNGALLRASTDSVSWTTRTNNTLNSQTITLLSSFGSYAFAHGTNYMSEYDFLNVSTNNIVWQLRTSGFGRNQIISFGYGGAVYIAGGASGTLTVSTDTITWILRTSGTISYINNLKYLNSIYLYSTPFVNGSTATVSTITNTLLGAASLTSSTTPTSGTNDQGFWFLALPWSIIYNGTFYDGVYVSTNSMLNFGGTSYETPITDCP